MSCDEYVASVHLTCTTARRVTHLVDVLHHNRVGIDVDDLGELCEVPYVQLGVARVDPTGRRIGVRAGVGYRFDLMRRCAGVGMCVCVCVCVYARRV